MSTVIRWKRFRPNGRILGIGLLLALVCLVGSGGADYAAPKDWRREVIALPPEFAPQMAWRGEEILHFAPGMFKSEAPDFFSYVFSLKFEGDAEPQLEEWDQQLLLYYRGLATSVGKGKISVERFSIKLAPTSGGGFHGRLDWVEPFVTKKPQKLFLEISRIEAGYWFVCASPAAPHESVWTQLRRVRNTAF